MSGSVKRKVGLFLLAVIIAVTLTAMLVVSLEMYDLVSGRQEQDIRDVEASLQKRFDIFETMLRTEHGLIMAHMEHALPQIEAVIERLAPTPAGLSPARLAALSKEYDVDSIYFIDRSHRVYQTNLASDLNLQFPPSGFTKFLDSVFGQGKVMNVGIDIAARTGKLNTYSYYGPLGKDYILEASTDIRSSLSQGDFGWMASYFFGELFHDAGSQEYIRDVDIYLVNEDAAWSLLRPGATLSPTLAQRAIATGRVEIPEGRLVTVYSTDPTQTAADSRYAARSVIRKITYDVSLAREAVMKVVASSLLVLALGLPLIYWLASYLLQKQMLNPLFRLRGQAETIAAGKLDLAIADTERRDEIGSLARSFASMRDAVRRTILDLKEVNASIERFVPRAFLALIDKPSIVTVKLGDNKRRNMTVLFSDIRNFTGLSEQMTPDENFAFINAYLERMGPVIRTHRGFIDKYIGDAIMALFEEADHAVAAGLAMLETLAAYNAERRTRGVLPIQIGVGINSGSLMLGTIGEKDRMDGTVISDAVNLAARIESLTKTYGINLLISQNTYDQLADPRAHDIRPIDVVIVRGKTQPVAIFEVFDWNLPEDHAAKSRTRELLIAGVEALARHDGAAARREFERALALFPGDPAALKLLKCCAA
jgi:class 3 adenylate cyclase